VDASETYIKMCEKANEIQALWKPSKGDIFFLPDEIKPAGKTRTYVLGCHWEKCEGCKWELKHGDWILRQDQLQEMLSLHVSFFGLEELFHQFIKTKDDKGDEIPSLEQCWLMFVMSVNWNKAWNGIDWVKETT
jgi:hypothetical protein